MANTAPPFPRVLPQRWWPLRSALAAHLSSAGSVLKSTTFAARRRLLFLLGNTADAYFSPTLGVICANLGISEDLAGVTFLAFGNGAPDMFSSFAAFTHGNSSPGLGLGALLGAGVFVQTVVLGAVCLSAAPVRVAPRSFLRDLVFFTVTMAAFARRLTRNEGARARRCGPFFQSARARLLGFNQHERA